MSSGCGDTLSLQDLQTAKKHQLFEAEVITGKQGGVAGGANIDFATNQVTGQTQKTLPAVLRDAGFNPASFTFTTGGTLGVNDADKAVLWPVAGGGDGAYYAWFGALPKVIPASSSPATTGGIAPGAWKQLGDITLRDALAAANGTSLIGLPAGGTLANTILTVSAEQFGAIGNGAANSTASIQAAIDYVFAAGGGVVEFGAKMYRAANLLLKPRVVLRGLGKELTTIKAPNAWTGNAVIMSQGYLTYEADSATQVVPACFNAGVIGMCIDGNKANFSGTAAKDVGCGILHAGCNMIFNDVKIIYAPSVGFVTREFGTNRALYQAANTDKAWPHIGLINNIRIQFCGNDCWHNDAQDYYINDVEIAGAGDGYVSTDDRRSFWAPTERVANFRTWRSVDLNDFHSYGNYNGYGIVAGPDTSVFAIRLRYGSIIVESCLIGAWFKKSCYGQGSRLDFHAISQHLPVPLHPVSTYPPAVIIESSTNSGKVSNWGSIHGIQSTDESGYSSYGVQLGGQFNVADVVFVKSPTVAAAQPGAGVVLTGDHNRLTGSIRGCYGVDANGVLGTALTVGSGNHRVDVSIGFSNVGYRVFGGSCSGTIHNEGGLNTWQVGFDTAGPTAKANLNLTSSAYGNHSLIKSAGGSVANNSTSDQTVTMAGLSLPYIPASYEVSAHLSIDAFVGSAVYPRLSAVTYLPASSSLTQLVFVVRLQNSDSPMQLSLTAQLN